MKRHPFAPLVVVTIALFGSGAHAQDEAAGSDAAQANNPLADIKAFNIQNYYVP